MKTPIRPLRGFLLLIVLWAGLAALAWSQPPATLVVQGAGATFPEDIYSIWAERYQAVTGTQIQYQATGSGDGERQIKARLVAFGGTDTPLTPQELAEHRLIQVPTVAGAVVPVFNLRALAGRRLQLSGEVLGEMFSGRIERWNDPRIVALNPGVALPNLPVRRIVRSDTSGTTHAFTRYLALVSRTFETEVGASRLPRWPGEVLSAAGNSGVVKLLQNTEGGLTYVGYDRVRSQRLSSISLQDTAGRPVQASEASILTALRASDVHRTGDDSASTLNMSAPGSWPIVMVTFLLFDAEPARASDVEPAMRFLVWSFLQGDRLVSGTGFAPLPVLLQARLFARLMQVRPRDGRAVHLL